MTEEVEERCFGNLNSESIIASEMQNGGCELEYSTYVPGCGVPGWSTCTVDVDRMRRNMIVLNEVGEEDV